MDDPRHKKLRGLVSSGFGPKQLNQLLDQVQVRAAGVIDAVQDEGRVRLRQRDRRADAAADRLRHGRRAAIARADRLRADEHHPRRRRPRVRADLRGPDGRVHDAAPDGDGARAAPPRRPVRRHHEHPHARGGRRRAPHRPRVRVVLHPARRRRQRDDAHRDQPRDVRAAPEPRPEGALDERLRPLRAGRRRGDRAVGDAGDPLPPHRDPGHRDRRATRSRRARRS